MRYIERHVVVQALRREPVAVQTRDVPRMDKMCANFYELINEQKLTNRQANGVRTFCQENIRDRSFSAISRPPADPV